MGLHELGHSAAVPGALEELAHADSPPGNPTFERRIESIYGRLRGSSTGKPAAMALIHALERRVEATADQIAARLLEGGDLAWDALERMATEMLSAQNAARLARNLLDKYGLTKRWGPFGLEADPQHEHAG
jgi:hypothetical protein